MSATLKPVPQAYSTFCTRYVLGGDSAVNTGAAAISLAPAVSGKRMWVNRWTVVNKTAGEYPVCQLTEDPLGTPVIKDFLSPDQNIATSLGERVHDYGSNPIPIAAGKAVGYSLQSATGDTYSTVDVWLED